MLFNSAEFLIGFLPIALLVFFLSAKYAGGRASHVALIILSLCFYAWWEWMYVFLIVGSTVANYLFGGLLLKNRSKALLAISVSINICVLAYFKYTNFALENIYGALGYKFEALAIILPLGISFFTFQKIGYLVDCYKGKVHDRDPVRFGLFVLFFPQLIAGPIVHHNQIIPQLRGHERSPLPTDSMVAKGIFYLVLGLFKKVVIADNIANVITPGFANVGTLQFVEAWTVSIGYSLQLYFDFSAYSEMAIGLGMLFGVLLPVNFNSPYKATSITDFWRRWHITLGAFMREYIYIPLGGNKSGLVVALWASMATMLIGGLWHGAAWTFVFWGALHGCALAVHKAWKATGKQLPDKAGMLLTLIFVVFAWVPFRAESMGDTFLIWSKMVGFDGVSLPMVYQAFPLVKNVVSEYHISNIFNGFEIFGMILVMYFAVTMKNVHEYCNQFEANLKTAIGISFASLAGIFSLAKPSTFLYFNF